MDNKNKPTKTNKEILNIIVSDPKYYNAVSNITKGHSLTDDLFNELLCIIGEYDNKKLNKLVEKKALKFYFIRICLNQWRSNTSPFYKKYKKDNQEKLDYETEMTDISNEVEEEIFYEPTWEDKVKSIVEEKLSTMHWYKRELFNLYVDLGSYRAVSEETDIPIHSVSSDLKYIRYVLRNTIKKNLNDEYQETINRK